MLEFIQIYQSTVQTLEEIIFHAFVQAYLSGLTLLIHGSSTSRISVAVILFGLTYLFRQGLWKMVLKVLGHWAWAKI